VRNRTLVKMDPHVPFFFCSYVLLYFCCNIYLEGQEIHAQTAPAGVAAYCFRIASRSRYLCAVSLHITCSLVGPSEEKLPSVMLVRN